MTPITVHARYPPTDDTCLSIWADVYATCAFDFPLHATVLEIGCAEADWMSPMMQARPDLKITGIDWRECPARHGVVVRGDVLTVDFPEASFDAIVGISSIEHIGLGHYKADPLDIDGDVHCMQRVARWLKPGGWVYLDVPYDPSGYRVQKTECRVYDDAAIEARLIPTAWPRQVWFADHAGKLLTEKPVTPMRPFHYVAIWTQQV